MTLEVRNGEADGSGRTSAARVLLDGERVVQESDLGPAVAELLVPVAPLGSTSLCTSVRGEPGSSLTVTLGGWVVDEQAPALELLAPTPPGRFAGPEDALLLRATDDLAGIEVGSLRVWLGDLDVTVPFAETVTAFSA